MKKNKGFSVRNNIIYVQGSIDGVFKRYSTKKQNTKINLLWIAKNCRDVLLKLHDEKTNLKIVRSNSFEKFAYQSLELNSDSRKESTNKEYKSILTNYILKDFKHYTLQDIKKADLQIWQNKLVKEKLPLSRIRFLRAVLSGILNDAVQNEIILKNPLAFVKLPKRDNEVQKEIIPFSLDEIKAIINASTGQYKNIITILFFSGMRTGELWGLKWSDINFRSNTIHIQRGIRHGVESTPKTKSSNRTIEMLPLVEEALKRQKAFTYQNDSYVILSRLKTPYASAQKISEGYWKNVLKFCGIDYRVLYQTRHTFASMMISQGEDIVWVSKLLGHSSVRVTLEIYTKYIPDIAKKRATFLSEFKLENCTKTAQPNFKFLRSS